MRGLKQLKNGGITHTSRYYNFDNVARNRIQAMPYERKLIAQLSLVKMSVNFIKGSLI